MSSSAIERSCAGVPQFAPAIMSARRRHAWLRDDVADAARRLLS